MNERKLSASERKVKSIAESVLGARKLLNRALTALNKKPEHISAAQLVKLIDSIYKTQKILSQLEDESDGLLRKLLNRDVPH